jgi:single-strand selective monofunctional uracil DNA glycosylase
MAGRTRSPLHPILDELLDELAPLDFAPPVTHVYNPLRYARRSHDLYLDRFGHAAKEAVLVGMNPGPWGMAQTGVPFGEIEAVRDWLGIEAPVGKPADEHPKRPVEGFACTRSEVSGRRLWGWARERFGTPEAFFERFFVYNYCPLSFLEDSGRNRTPDKLRKPERQALFAACDRALRRTVETLSPRLVIGIGKFAEDRARLALDGADEATDFEIGRILHPSPASPAANRGWAEQAERGLAALGIRLP